MEALGRNPARLIPAWRRFLSEHAQDGRGVRILSEAAWPGRSPAELNECSRYESLLDLAFGQGQAWRLLCGYDARAVPEAVIGTERGALGCEVSDAGHIEEPLVGRVHPATDRTSGRGLWLVNHLCDLVQIRSSPQGTVVRVYMLVAD